MKTIKMQNGGSCRNSYESVSYMELKFYYAGELIYLYAECPVSNNETDFNYLKEELLYDIAEYGLNPRMFNFVREEY